MKHIINIAAILLLAVAPYLVNAQCKDFVKTTGLSLLDTKKYLHDGHFNATSLEEGEEVELFKTFFSGEQYRIAVANADNLSKVEFEILDLVGNLIYSNKKDNYAKTWDMTVESSQKLIITVRVPAPKNASNPQSGCVAVIIGMKNK